MEIEEKLEAILREHEWTISDEVKEEVKTLKEEMVRSLEEKLKVLKAYGRLIADLPTSSRIFDTYKDAVQKINAIYQESESIERDLRDLEQFLPTLSGGVPLPK